MAKAVGQFTIIDLNDITISSTAPAVKIVDMIWLDTSMVPNQFKKWSGTAWINIGDRNSDIQINSRNLLLQSGVAKSGINYLIDTWILTENFIAGTKYTVVLEGTKAASQTFGAWMNSGSSGLGTLTNIAGTNLYKLTFTAVAPTAGNERKISIYNPPSSSNAWTLKWIAMYKGADKIPLDWTPAPEDTDQKLTSYYTKTETNTQINTAKDSINLSVDTKISTATTTINQRTDQVLTSYSTTSQMNAAIDLKANAIDLAVSQKILGTYYQEATPTSPKNGEFWYKPELSNYVVNNMSMTVNSLTGVTVENFKPIKKLYRYNGTVWQLVEDSDINDVKSSVAGINITAERIVQRVEDSDGRIGSLEVSASIISSRVSDAEGNISIVQQTATALSVSVQNLQLDVNALSTNIGTLTGRIDDIDLVTDSIKLATNAAKLEFNAGGLTIKNGGFKILNGTQQVFYVDANGKLIMISEFYNTTGSYGVRIANGKIEVSSGNSAPGPSNWGAVCGNVYGIYQDFHPNGSVNQLILEGINGAKLKTANYSAYFGIAYNNIYINGNTININGDSYVKKKHSAVLSTDYVLVSAT